jgi:hypothetical protein
MANQQDASAGAAGDPAQDPPAQGTGDDTGQQGYTIEIHVDPQGAISVGVDTGADEQDEGAGDDAGELQPAKNIKDALTIALDIFRNEGQMTQGPSADDDMASGFGGPSAAAQGSGGGQA